MKFKFDKDELKESLSIDQVFEFVAEMGGEPLMDKSDTFFTAKTLCHNHVGEGSHKLYYYDNTHLFKCYTDCGDTFDIYELVLRAKAVEEEEWPLPQAIAYVARYFGIAALEDDFENIYEKLPDWDYLNNHKRNSEQDKKEKIVELKVFDDSFLSNLPHPRILDWEEEGVTQEIIKSRGICYDPKNEGIVIPHYDIDDRLIGVRERTLIKENEKYGKYRPAIINRQMYNHPLGFNLYNINHSKNNIKTYEKVIIFEGEKSCLLYASYFGADNDISVAVCGSNLISYQVKLLLSLGVKEIVVAFDKQFQEIGDDEWKKWTKKLTNINTKYSRECQISFIFDKDNLLGYKESPIDRGPDVFLELFKRRVVI